MVPATIRFRGDVSSAPELISRGVALFVCRKHVFADLTLANRFSEGPASGGCLLPLAMMQLLEDL